eukprot:scaffold6322_cov59-Cylindrotheca_fusiformis.AAC.13
MVMISRELNVIDMADACNIRHYMRLWKHSQSSIVCMSSELEVLDQKKLKPNGCGVWNKCCFCLLKKEKMVKSRKTGIPMRIQWMNNEDHQETRTLSRQFEESGHQYAFLADVRQAELNINNPHTPSWMTHPLTKTKNMESCSIQFYSILLCSFYLQTVFATTTINLWIPTKGFDDLFSKIKDTIV